MMSTSFQQSNSGPSFPSTPPNHYFLRRGLYCRYMGCEDPTAEPYEFSASEDNGIDGDGNGITTQPNKTIDVTIFHNPHDVTRERNTYYLIPVYALGFLMICYFLMRIALKVQRGRRQLEQQRIQEQQAMAAAKKQKQHEEDLRKTLFYEFDIQNLCMIVEESDIVNNTTSSAVRQEDTREEDLDDIEAGTLGRTSLEADSGSSSSFSFSSFLKVPVQRKDSESDRVKEGNDNSTKVKGASEVGRNAKTRTSNNHVKTLDDGEVESTTTTTDNDTVTTVSEQDLVKSSYRVYFDIENPPRPSRKEEDVEYFLCLPCTEEECIGGEDGYETYDSGDEEDADGDKRKPRNGHRRQVPNMCAICLDSYGVGDAVVWSKKLCTHAFHRNCLVNSLCLVKDDNKLPCPTCRQDFLTMQHKEGSNINDDDNNKNNASDDDVVNDATGTTPT